MKKLFISSFLLFISVFAFGQNSIEIIPTRTSTKGTTYTFQTFSTADTYRGYVGVYSNLTDVDFGTGQSTTGKLHLVIGAVPKLTIDNLGNVGVGTTTPSSTYKFNIKGGGFLVENSTSTRSMFYNPNSINDMVFTGGDAYINTNVSNSTMKLQVFGDTQLSIGSVSSATGKVQISHLASTSSPTLHLKSTGSSSSIIRATSTAIGSEWDNHFVNNASAASNFVYWTNSVNNTTPLILTGEGDAVVERNVTIGGFTSLGNDVSAPKIKMKKLTLTNGATGVTTPVTHGLTQSKIISVSVLINGSTTNDIPPRSTYSGFEYDYYVSSTQVFIKNISGNDASIINRPVRILITYEE